jgi:hypothetical protein
MRAKTVMTRVQCSQMQLTHLQGFFETRSLSLRVGGAGSVAEGAVS